MSNATTRKGAVRRRAGRCRAGRRVPLVWFGSGMLSAFAACGLLYMTLLTVPEPRPATDQAEVPEPGRQLDFYRMLRDSSPEVTAPPEALQEDAVYRLQAGSFRRGRDADSRRAEVLLLGLEAYTEKHRVDGQTWHRVFVGPLKSGAELSRAQARLAAAEIESIALKTPDSG